jgi:hypothetical protein
MRVSQPCNIQERNTNDCKPCSTEPDFSTRICDKRKQSFQKDDLRDSQKISSCSSLMTPSEAAITTSDISCSTAQ